MNSRPTKEGPIDNKENKLSDSFLNQLKEAYKNSINSSDDVEKNRQANQLVSLINAFKKIEEDNVLISIGTALIGAGLYRKPEQQLPTYIQEISKHESVRIIMIDGLFGNDGTVLNAASYNLISTSDEKCEYTSIDKERKLTVQTFGCYLPYGDSPEFKKFYDTIENSLSIILSRKGRVFIANHTQAWSLEDIPAIAALYNSLKQSHPNADLLQLYTQGGNNKVRYYLNKEYTSASDPRDDDAFEAQSGEFKICDSIINLCSVKEFSPRSNQPSPLVAKSLFSKEPANKDKEDLKNIPSKPPTKNYSKRNDKDDT